MQDGGIVKLTETDSLEGDDVVHKFAQSIKEIGHGQPNQKLRVPFNETKTGLKSGLAGDNKENIGNTCKGEVNEKAPAMFASAKPPTAPVLRSPAQNRISKMHNLSFSQTEKETDNAKPIIPQNDEQLDLKVLVFFLG